MDQVKVDFRRVKREVPIVAVLERYGVKMRGANGQLSGECPLPTHTSKDSKSSFKVNAEMNVWCCKSTSCVNAYREITGKMGGDVIDFVSAMDDCRVLDAAKKLLHWFPGIGEPQNGRPKAEPKPEPVPEKNKPLNFELKGIVYHPYLEGRGISEELAQKFGVGFFPGKGSMSGRVVIPIHDEAGALVAYCGRALGNEDPRYKMPLGFQKSQVLFNLHAITVESITLTEGFFSTMKVVEAGFPGVGLMGSTLSEAQEKLLRRFKFVTLMVDPDDAGRAGTADMITRLTKCHYVRVAQNDKCPDDMTKAEIQNVLRYVCPITKPPAK